MQSNNIDKKPERMRDRRQVNWEAVGAMSGIISLVIAIAVWLVPNLFKISSEFWWLAAATVGILVAVIVLTLMFVTLLGAIRSSDFSRPLKFAILLLLPLVIGAILIASPSELRGKILFTVFNEHHATYDLYIADIDGSDQRLLYEQTRQPEFRGDGLIVANGDGADWTSLVVMNADGSNRHPITNRPEDKQPSWSPGGVKVVHSSSRHGRRNKEGNPIWNIYIQDDASRQTEGRPLEIGNYHVIGRYPTWLPDGHIAFNGCQYWTGEGGNCGLWAIWEDGTDVSQLTNVSNDLAVDGYGNEIVFMSDQRDGNWEIYKANNVSGDITRLTDNPAIDGLPTWSPDGKHIAFLSTRDGQWAIWVMNADGSNQWKLFDLPGLMGPDWPEERISWWAP